MAKTLRIEGAGITDVHTGLTALATRWTALADKVSITGIGAGASGEAATTVTTWKSEFRIAGAGGGELATAVQGALAAFSAADDSLAAGASGTAGPKAQP